jgi:hypothetical protein
LERDERGGPFPRDDFVNGRVVLVGNREQSSGVVDGKPRRLKVVVNVDRQRSLEPKLLRRSGPRSASGEEHRESRWNRQAFPTSRHARAS